MSQTALSQVGALEIDVLKQMVAYANQIKKTVMQEGKDYIIDGKKQYTARSGFSRLAQAFCLSDEEPILTEVNEPEPVEYSFKHYIRKVEHTRTFTTSVFAIEAKVKVVHLPSGRYAWGEGACTVQELDWTFNLGPKWYHRVLATAKTRALNRAISNYIGSADVSAEEMGITYPGGDEAPATQPRRQAESTFNIMDYMKAKELKAPEWDLKDELNRSPESWGDAKNITETWMKETGFNVDGFKVTVNKDRIAVKANKAIPVGEMPAVSEVMVGAGFTQTRNLWRLQKKDVIG